MTGGTEVQTLNLVQALIAGGHRVVTVCYFENCEDMVSRFQNAGCEVVCLSPDGIRIDGWRGILFLYKGLRSVLKQYKPDVAHVQYMAPGAIPILLLRLLGMRQILTTAHTAADIYPSLKLVHFIQRHCVRAFTCITELAERSFFGSSQLYDENYPLKNAIILLFTMRFLPAFLLLKKEYGKLSDDHRGGKSIGVDQRYGPGCACLCKGKSRSSGSTIVGRRRWQLAQADGATGSSSRYH